MTDVTPTSIESLLSLYERRGGDTYGEDVTQTAHALQCASLARDDGASDELIAAALLHDVGHLLAPPPDNSVDDPGDDRHEALGARVLAPLFGPLVAGPVALHVTAKRWRCTVDPAYHSTLSEASVLSLAQQGGLLDDLARRRFEDSPAHADAVSLRTWDDAAKDPLARTGPLSDYATLLERLLARTGAAR